MKMAGVILNSLLIKLSKVEELEVISSVETLPTHEGLRYFASLLSIFIKTFVTAYRTFFYI